MKSASGGKRAPKKHRLHRSAATLRTPDRHEKARRAGIDAQRAGELLTCM
ncbi:hypothetical protein [Nisaea sp.]